jgi:hypothetical protein
MAYTIVDMRTGQRIALRPCGGRQAEQRARRQILRELDRLSEARRPATAQRA